MRIKHIAVLFMAAACLTMGVPRAHANGMIIPAYLPLTDTTSWQILAEDAAIMRDGTNANYKDYWVTVNSGNNGPFSSPADWATAAARFDPIRANSGKIFGYVHTTTTPTSGIYRPLIGMNSVEADITAWVTGYPNIDGIWIDEFYPRYEIATGDDDRATFPNGPDFAPTDRSFVNPDGTINPNVQVNPAGGYYWQLTDWIHRTYPNLRIIGNAGGWFYSNQVNYGSLVDVDCSFEQTYENASMNGWGNLNRQPGNTAAQLALIHTNSNDLNGAIDQAISHGYTHFYTTNGVLTNNIWGALPPYFTSEVQYIANHS